MAQPEIIKDIDARVKDTGDTMTGNLTAPTFIGSLQGNADTATKASQDSDGAVISSTYLKLSGGIMTGPITLASKGYQTNNAAGYYTDEYGNFVHSQAGTGDYWHIGNNAKTIFLKYYFETGNLSIQGTMTAPTFIGSLQGNASSSTYSTYIYFRDTRNANEMPLDMLKGVSLHLKSNSADGLSDGLSYHPVLMLRDWNDLSGGPFAELTITGNQNLYFRSSTTNADNTWNPWRKVLTDYNYTSILNNTYLPLTGGTMSGPLNFANGTWNLVGDDCYYGDQNIAGAFCIKGHNGNTNLSFFQYGGSNVGKITWDGNQFVFSHIINGNISGNAATASSSYYLKGRTYWESWANNGNYSGVQYLQGQLASSTTPAANKVYLGSSGEYSVISAPTNTYQNGGTNNPCNVMLLRFYWGTTYFREISSSPNNDTIMTRNVKNGSPDPWRRIWQEGESVTGAVWNDYAECREADTIEPGYVLVETGNDTLTKSTERLSPFAGISSDTWGFSQGETDKAKTPIAVAGRVLAYTYRDRNEYKPGDCVCAAPGGTIDIMTREEIINYPDRIVGTVSNVPNYETWGGGEGADRDPVSVNGRIWIKVK